MYYFTLRLNKPLDRTYKCAFIPELGVVAKNKYALLYYVLKYKFIISFLMQKEVYFKSEKVQK